MRPRCLLIESWTDRFGGIPVRLVKPSGPFRIRKVRHRWMFVSPEGHAVWGRDVRGKLTGRAESRKPTRR